MAKGAVSSSTQAVEWWNETPSAGVPELNLEAAPADTTPLEAPTAGSGQ